LDRPIHRPRLGGGVVISCHGCWNIFQAVRFGSETEESVPKMAARSPTRARSGLFLEQVMISMSVFQPLKGIRVVTLALNLPGPVAIRRMVDWGAAVVKVEPLGGDPMEFASPAVFDWLHQGVEIQKQDLKSPAGMEVLQQLLAGADLFLTSSRLGGLDRLGLGWEVLSGRYPDLVMVAIVGHEPPGENLPGHDLTYQAHHGLVSPPGLPRSLFADLGGSLEAVAAALGLLLLRSRGKPTAEQRRRIVSLERSAAFFSQPIEWGFTSPAGFLGGGLPQYNLYRCETGWVGLAALEPHFWARLQSLLGLDNPTQTELQEVFQTRSADSWEAWAREHDLPLVAVRDNSTMKSSHVERKD
jgi:crotonobetainyl-CoA:carnitine CoA-transferase CaiB-like acyl-CoA transferase